MEDNERQHRTAELSFMLVGHTKFAPDRHFGLIKKRFRRSSLFEMARVVKESTTTGKTKPQTNHKQTIFAIFPKL